jgi:hypothetical protein
VQPGIRVPDIFRDAFAGCKIAIFVSGEFRHADSHCVAPFVAEREQKVLIYQWLLRDKHNW